MIATPVVKLHHACMLAFHIAVKCKYADAYILAASELRFAGHKLRNPPVPRNIKTDGDITKTRTRVVRTPVTLILFRSSVVTRPYAVNPVSVLQKTVIVYLAPVSDTPWAIILWLMTSIGQFEDSGRIYPESKVRRIHNFWKTHAWTWQ